VVCCCSFWQIIHRTAVAATARRFFPSEDRLAVIGLREQGPWDWMVLATDYIPSRTIRQISQRYSRAKFSTAESEIKDFHIASIRPLSPQEQQLLEKGVEKYGTNFSRISHRMLPDKAPSILRCAWRLMVSQKKAVPYTSFE
jgi:uncharacterized DUF497 family protein